MKLNSIEFTTEKGKLIEVKFDEARGRAYASGVFSPLSASECLAAQTYFAALRKLKVRRVRL